MPAKIETIETPSTVAQAPRLAVCQIGKASAR